MSNPTIRNIRVYGPVGEFGESEEYGVGENGVTEIRQSIKPGMHSDIPYLEIWKGDKLLAVFCQHNVAGVYYDRPDDSDNVNF